MLFERFSSVLLEDFLAIGLRGNVFWLKVGEAHGGKLAALMFGVEEDAAGER
jgi:hypothetical protein